MIIHTCSIPFLDGEPVLEFRELSVHDLEHTMRTASREDPLNPVLAQLKAQAAQRLLAIRGFGDVRIDNGDNAGPADVIAAMTPKVVELYKKAFDRVHEPSEEEQRAFFETMKRQEVP
jgi:hypothetical protein